MGSILHQEQLVPLLLHKPVEGKKQLNSLEHQRYNGDSIGLLGSPNLIPFHTQQGGTAQLCSQGYKWDSIHLCVWKVCVLPGILEEGIPFQSIQPEHSQGNIFPTQIMFPLLLCSLYKFVFHSRFLNQL